MNEHRPDCWVIIELSGTLVKGGPIRKVLAGWYGGYLGSDSWRGSSGIERIVDGGDYWEVHNYSGSVYYCRKGAERFTGLTSSVFHDWGKQAEQFAEGELTIRHVPIDEIPIS